MNSSGSFFTWCSQQAAESRVYWKLDRVIGDVKWLEVFPQARVEYCHSVLSNRALAILSLQVSHVRKPPFRFLDMWALRPEFSEVLTVSWHGDVEQLVMIECL